MSLTKRKTPFLKNYALSYGVRVSECSTSNPAVVISVECLFCIRFEREEKIGSKYACTVDIKYYRAPFRTDDYI